MGAGGLKEALKRALSGRQFDLHGERSRFLIYKLNLPLHLLVYLDGLFLSFAFRTPGFLTVSDLERLRSFVGLILGLLGDRGETHRWGGGGISRGCCNSEDLGLMCDSCLFMEVSHPESLIHQSHLLLDASKDRSPTK